MISPWGDLGIPAFLRISQARRAKAWRDYSARQDLGPRRAEFDQRLYDKPGAVAQRLGYFNANDETAIAALAAREDERRAAAEYKSKARLYALEEERRKEREAGKALRAEAAKAHAAFNRERRNERRSVRQQKGR